MLRKKSPEPQADTAQFDGVSLRYEGGADVIKDISLILPQKSFFFLTGPSGAGKTSLLSMLYLANRPSRGTLRLFGEDVTKASRSRLAAMRRRLGVVFQDFRLLEHLSAFDNVALPLRIAGTNENLVKQNVSEILSWVGLAEQMDARPAVLSGGQKQRVAIARAVVNRPRMILADEPTGNVDDAIAFRLMLLFVELYKLGTTVVVGTHNESLVARFPFPRLHLEDGVITMLPPVDPQATVPGMVA